MDDYNFVVGRTPLCVAALFGNDSICKILISNGAGVNIPNNNGKENWYTIQPMC